MWIIVLVLVGLHILSYFTNKEKPYENNRKYTYEEVYRTRDGENTL